MRNISFDNPYLLLLLLPLLALLIVPYAIAVRRENRSRSVVASFVLHLLIACFVTLAIAGTVVTTVMTETNVYVLADVSYSTNKNLDLMDRHIADLQKKLPRNSSMGLICFGKDCKLVTEMGGETVSVKNSGVDDSATNISDAIEYASTLFEDGVIKRIVLITDGKETDSDATGKLIAAIENLHVKGIYIDAIYVDSNLSEGAKEVQLSGVDFTTSTYLNHATTADVLR